MKIAENICRLRKARGMTQERLAEALGVSFAAVSKWERGVSTPELPCIIGMAELFGVSVDVLLGYQIQSGGRKETAERLKALRRSEFDESALAEAERALACYPNCFDVVYSAARMYDVKGVEGRDRQKRRRALELFEHALRLIDQNTDETVCELSISVDIAQTLISLGEPDKAVAMLKENNPRRVNHALIGCTLASSCNRPDEAMEYLSRALLDSIVMQFRVVVGYINAYIKKKAYREALDILNWLIGSYAGLVEPGKTCFLIKDGAVLLSICAYASVMLGETEEARAYLRRAKAEALRFDAAPDYRGNSVRFFVMKEPVSVYDDMGATAMQSVERCIAEEACGELTRLWEDVRDEA